MKLSLIEKNNEILAHLNLFTDFDVKEGLAERIVEQISEDADIGFAGYSHKNGLLICLKWFIGEIKVIEPIDKDKTKTVIEESVKQCSSILNIIKPIHIFVFPTFNEFVKIKMAGSNGCCPWKNTIHVYINPTENWQIAVRNTICHEFAHAIAQNYNRMITILDQLIFDGVAEHFRDFVLGGDKSPWVKALTEEEAKKILSEISDKFDSVDENFRNEIFYGAGKYPLWAGYTIGYYIVGKYLEKQKNVDWNEVIKLSPKTIMKDSRVLS